MIFFPFLLNFLIHLHNIPEIIHNWNYISSTFHNFLYLIHSQEKKRKQNAGSRHAVRNEIENYDEDEERGKNTFSDIDFCVKM